MASRAVTREIIVLRVFGKRDSTEQKAQWALLLTPFRKG